MTSAPARTTARWAGLLAGPALAALAHGLLPGPSHGGLDASGRATAGVALWMATWWLTEAIPIAATALLPVVVLPLLGARSIAEVTRPYAHHLLFLFLGGFLVALSMERWGLHRRIALRTLAFVGTRPRHIVAGFMGITALLSMWTSNTATTVVMLPIALSVIDRMGQGGNTGSEDEPGGGTSEPYFAPCLVLGIAYAASIGGVGTLIGTPPNLFLASYAREQLGHEIGFAQWLLVGVPLVVVMLPIAWALLTRILYPVGAHRLPGGRTVLRQQLAELGTAGRGERITLVVFVAMALAWITRPLLTEWEIAGVTPLSGLTDTGIAMAAALSLFVIPVDLRTPTFTMDWATATRVPWGILILFGGGLSLAAALQDTGVTAFLGRQMEGLHGVPIVVVTIVVTATVMLLTEVTSNTATTTAFVPILAGVAPGLGLDPLQLIVPAAIAASCAFMMPVATPPNAVVFGSGYISIPQMSRAGFWLNIVAIGVVTAIAMTLVMPVLGTP